MDSVKRELAAIIAIDFAKAAMAEEEGISGFPSPHSLVSKNHGTVLGNMNGSFVAKFGSPEEAVLCGLEYCEKIKRKWPDSESLPLRIILTTGEIIARDGIHHGSGVEKIALLHSNIQNSGFYLTGEIFVEVKKMVRTNFSRVGNLGRPDDGLANDLYLVRYDKDLLRKVTSANWSQFALNATMSVVLILILAVVGWGTFGNTKSKKPADLDEFRSKVKNAIFKDK